jgi:hypothetical protein
MSESKRYSIVWQECGPNSRIAERFHVPGYDGFLPFFIWGDELTSLEHKEKVELREEHLLKGILYGLYEFDHHPNPWLQKEDRDTLLYLLDVLGNGFRFESPEKMILDIAFDVRIENGNRASRTILEVGKELIPRSAKIKSDLICDLWEMLADHDKVILEEIVSLIPEIQLDDITSDAKEVICYYGLCAIILLGKDDIVQSYLERYIYPNVTLNELKHKIKALLEEPKGFTAADLKVHDAS